METITPTNARKNFYELLGRVSEKRSSVEITNFENDGSVVLISKKDWETL